jgi:LacI family transcriptional regulator
MPPKRKRAATILDVAAAAGVSASTVSRFLTGSIAVAADTQVAIRTAIDALGYRPNKVARGLVNGSSNVIGVLTQHIASPFYGEMLTGVEQGLRGSAYTPLIIPGNWELQEQLHAVDVFLESRVDAMIIFGGNIPNERLQELSEEMPVIIIGRTVPGMERYCIHADNFHGAYAAVQYLLSLGHTQIAHLAGISEHEDSMRRREGYVQAITDAGLEVNPQLIIEGDFREQSGLMAVEMLLVRSALFSAIFVANDQMATGVQLALYRRGLRIPDDVSIVGFDDQPGSAYSRPPLTTVRYPTFEIGHAATAGILKMLEGEEPEFPTFSTELVVRESATRVQSQRSFSTMNAQDKRPK